MVQNKVYEHIDKNNLTRIWQLRHNRQVVLELVSLFRVGLKDNLQKLSLAMESEDLSEMKSSVHRLKGSAANVGATALANALQKLETLLGVPKESLSSFSLQDELAKIEDIATKSLAELDRLTEEFF